MRWSRFSTIRILLIAVALTALATACSSQAGSCGQCGRAECRNLTFDVRLQDGKVVRTCCPRCALHYLAGPHPPVASMAAKDFDTAARIDASRAVYVEGSDVEPCTATAGSPPRDERGCCMRTVYDRCLPSLIAFESRAEAETFAGAHGGVLKTFAELQASAH